MKILRNYSCSLLWVISIILSAIFGYHKGGVDEKIQRMPFDLGIYLMMYEMTDYVNSSENVSGIDTMGLGNIKLLLYGTLDFYDKHKNKINKTAKGSTRFFAEIERARMIIDGFRVATLDSALEKQFINRKSKNGAINGADKSCTRGSDPITRDPIIRILEYGPIDATCPEDRLPSAAKEQRSPGD